jgi:hypothetical protein
MSLDFSPPQNTETANRILSEAKILFGAVKDLPISVRSGFPKILRRNSFGIAVHTTKTHAFLEITTKLRAKRSWEPKRIQVYRQLFTTPNSGEPALFIVSRLNRFSAFTVEFPHAFSLGADVSMCAWDMRSVADTTGGKQSFDIDLIYAVGYGAFIREADCWQEFDTLVRVTISDWSGMQ